MAGRYSAPIAIGVGGILVMTAALLAGNHRLRPFARAHLKPLKQMVLEVFPDLAAVTEGGADASSDRFLQHLRIDQPSERLRAMTTDLAPNETLLFVGPVIDPTFTQTYRTAAYLSWPRQIAVLGCNAPGAGAVALHPPGPGVAIRRALFYLQQPPEAMAPGARRIGPAILLTDVSERTEWISFCSQ
ncbi:MAG: hypothetical protein SF339_05275 [Blastocatellia bacterium]|nr:hypothetical protein [Blastocatellia bacterium]